jgi:hypothetical protein
MSLCKRICFVVLAVLLSANGAAQAVDVLRIMPLGDSNTRGTHVAESGGPHPAAIGAGGYRYPLQQMLTNGGYRFDFVGSQTSNGVGEQGDNPPSTWVYDRAFDPNHHGLAGFTSAGLIAGGVVPQLPGDPIQNAPPLVECLATYRPDIVLLMSGTNGVSSETTKAHLASLDSVIRTITTNSPDTRVIVSTVFDRWVAGEKDPATEAYNAGIPGLVTAAQQRGEHVSYVDAGGALSQADFDRPGADGVHPDPLKLGKVAAVWYVGIQSAAPLPEPSMLVLAGTALLLLAGYCLRQRR